MLPLLLLIASTCQATTGVDLREWNQFGGTAAGTRKVLVEPLRTAPVERWSLQAEELLSNVAAWGGVVYCAVREKGSRRLLAIDARTGDERGSSALGKGDALSLAVWQGTVVAVEPELLRSFRQGEDRLRFSKRLKGTFEGPVRVAEGLVFVHADETHLVCIDPVSGKEVARTRAGRGVPCVLASAEPGSLDVVTLDTGSHSMYAGTYLIARTDRLDGVHAKDRSFGDSRRAYSAPLEATVVPLLHEQVLIAGWRDPDAYEACYFLQTPLLLSTTGGRCYATFQTSDAYGPCDITYPYAVHQGQVLGFSSQDILIVMNQDGSGAEVVKASQLPADALPGPASIATDVAYFGGWAVDIESGRVLWSLPGMELREPAVPAADGCVVLATTDHRLIGLVAGDLPAAGGVATAAAARAPRPDRTHGLILATGNMLEGAARKAAEGSFEVIVDGAPRSLPAAEVAAWVHEGGVERSGEQLPVYLAFRAALRAEVGDLIERQFEDFRKRQCPADCQRLIQEARDWELERSLVDALEARCAGLQASSSGNAERLRAYAAEQEVERREETAASFLVAASWCSKHGMSLAAGALLGDAGRLSPGLELAVQMARGAAPAAFPWASEPDAGERWIAWATELLPADAEFVAASDPVREVVRGSVWQEDTLVLRSPRILLFSRDRDPVVVGACMRWGEGTVRVLEELGREHQMNPGEQRERLELRLHSSRKEYLEERAPDGSYAIPWSAGFYSPDEKVSRFYVERDAASQEPLGRDLYRVLAHEVTHHYLDTHWFSGRSSSFFLPGFWIVEGFARFLEDQMADVARRRVRLDDPAVPSIDSTAQCARGVGIFPVEHFFDMNQITFHEGLDDAQSFHVRLRNTIEVRTLTARGLFYEQAGAMAYFLFHECGAEGRAALFTLLRDYYSSELIRDPWERFQFPSAEEMEKSFREFLARQG